MLKFIYFFTEQAKTGKNGTHGNENLATYFWYFGSFDEDKLTKICNEPGNRETFQNLNVYSR